jgi:hypothetical protein
MTSAAAGGVSPVQGQGALGSGGAGRRRGGDEGAEKGRAVVASEAGGDAASPGAQVAVKRAGIRQRPFAHQLLDGDLHDQGAHIAPAAIEAGGRHPGALGDIGHGDLLVAALGHQGGGGLENLGLGAGAAAAGSGFGRHSVSLKQINLH